MNNEKNLAQVPAHSKIYEDYERAFSETTGLPVADTDKRRRLFANFRGAAEGPLEEICVVMNSLLIQGPMRGLCAESRKPLSVAVIYDTPLAREQVDQAYSNILKQFGMQESVSHWSSFAELASSDQGERSATLAAESDLLIIATVTGHDVPLRIREWIERWLSKLGGRKRALAVLVGVVKGQDLAALPVRQYLQHVADEWRLTFSASSFVLPDLLEELMGRSEYKCGWLADMLRAQSPSR